MLYRCTVIIMYCVQAGGHHRLDSYAVHKHVEDMRESMEAAGDKLRHVLEYQQAMGVVTEVPVSQVPALSLYTDNPAMYSCCHYPVCTPPSTPLGCTCRTACSRSGSWRVAVRLSERRKMMSFSKLLSYQNG